MFILNKPYLGTLLVNLYVIKQTLFRDVVKQTFIKNNIDLLYYLVWLFVKVCLMLNLIIIYNGLFNDVPK